MRSHSPSIFNLGLLFFFFFLVLASLNLYLMFMAQVVYGTCIVIGRICQGKVENGLFIM